MVTDTLPLGSLKLDGCRCRCGQERLPHGNEKPRFCRHYKSGSRDWDRAKQVRTERTRS